LLALLLLCGSSLAAQSPAEVSRRQTAEIAELRRVGDSLLVLWREARDLAQLQDSLEHVAAVGRLDTIDVHAIRIIANRSELPIREAAERLWPMFDSTYGDEAVRLKEHPVMLQVVAPDSGRRGYRQYWGMPVPSNTGVEELENILKGAIAIGWSDSALTQWVPGPVTPALFGTEREASDAYITVVASSRVVGRRCFEGDMPSCVAALRLDDHNETTLLAAFPTVAERQDVVGRLESFFRQRRNLDGLMDCRSGSDSACAYMIRSVPVSLIPQPLEREARIMLVHLALELGGRQAYHRLISDPTKPIGERLADAAGIPRDSLLVLWRQRVLAGRPAPVSLPLSGVLAGVIWIVVLGFFGTRSSRWRLG
jgi:hypothetical protein